VDYTHYDYLELAPGASAERIEDAYARVLERFNDGAPGGQDLSALVRMIHAAYRVLADPETRREYDERLQREAAAADAELKAIAESKWAPLPRRVQEVPQPLSAIWTALAA
jgi:molecular chaperone DnaJ